MSWLIKRLDLACVARKRLIEAGNLARATTRFRAAGGFTLLCLVLAAGCSTSQLKLTRFDRFQTPQVDAAPNTIASQVNRIRQTAEVVDQLPQADVERTVENLNEQLQDERSHIAVKTQAVRALGKIRSVSAIEGLANAAKSEDERLRLEACLALQNSETEEAARILAEVVALDPSNDVRLAAIRGLGQQRTSPAVQALGEALDDHDPAIQYAAMRSLEASTGQSIGMDVRKWKLAVNSINNSDVRLARQTEDTPTWRDRLLSR